ncbi:MAG: hypothetical protein KatS3mg068_1291 [Candidatus Sericytochromatia bacterium]|nr:MAG: hypothetical protein KatS3mg068_1291 [Candidatus Sericytochromatia bacterium]
MSINDLRDVKNKLIELRNSVDTEQDLLNLILEGKYGRLKRKYSEETK